MPFFFCLQYKFGNKLQCLLELAGAKIVAIEEFCLGSQGLDHGEINQMVCVIPTGSADKFAHVGKLSLLSRVNEVDLLCAVLSGHLDSSKLISPCVLVSSSCSTDETVVEDSDVEMETATSVNATANNCSTVVPARLNKEEISMVCLPVSSDNSQTVHSVNNNDGMRRKAEKVDEIETRNCDVLYSQYLISSSAFGSAANNELLNFKSFRKRNIQSGNSFNNLIPFSKYPYKESDHGNDEMIESMKEEKKRKQMEAIAEDLFNSEKSRRRRMAGSLQRLLSRG
uniref:Nibrin n=1 Tax=Rhizophora mucronata TaxID=61149 RepID=A0A2P2KGU4_RHIMU